MSPDRHELGMALAVALLFSPGVSSLAAASDTRFSLRSSTVPPAAEANRFSARISAQVLASDPAPGRRFALKSMEQIQGNCAAPPDPVFANGFE